jgi:hypothetical protein
MERKTIRRLQWIAGGISFLAFISQFEPVKTQVKTIYRNMTTPRGIRNNNPGNLVKTSIAWKGKVPHSQNTDGRFEQFISMEYGLRAMVMDLMNDMRKGKDTLEKLIAEFAPPGENNTRAYINTVAKAANLPPALKLSPTRENMFALVRAMTKVENGMDVVTLDLFEKAWKLL